MGELVRSGAFDERRTRSTTADRVVQIDVDVVCAVGSSQRVIQSLGVARHPQPVMALCVLVDQGTEGRLFLPHPGDRVLATTMPIVSVPCIERPYGRDG